MDKVEIPEKSFILPPEELARLGVKIDDLATASDKQSKSEHARTNLIEESVKTKNALKQTSKSSRQSRFSKNNFQLQTSNGNTLSSKHNTNLVPDNKLVSPSDVNKGSKIAKKSINLTVGNSSLNTENSKLPKSVENVTNLLKESVSKLSENEGSALTKNESNNASSALNTIKPGRGRLRKSSISSSLSRDNNIESTYQKEPCANTSSSGVKRRGRPKKTLVSNNAEKSSVSEQNLKNRKRGRAKIVDDDVDSDDEDFSKKSSLNKERRVTFSKGNPICDSDSDSNEDKPLADIIDEPPKKRGRPKKNATEAVTKNVPEGDTSIIFGISGRGRKRKDIDYSLLESSDVEMKEDKPKRVSYDNHCGSKADKNIKNHESINKIECDKDYALEDSNVKDVEPKITQNADESSENAENQKYTWTGNTVTALKQIFSVLHGKDVTEVRHDSQSGFAKRKRGKVKCNQDFLLDEDGDSVCMVCNKTVINREWLKHKRDVHYNLTWRKGDVPIDISNGTVIQKALTELRKEQGFLKCNKCNKKVAQTKTFMTHLEVCNGIVNASGSVTCAVCKTTMGKTEWQYHKYKEHNNLAWREGDPPLNLQDQDLVLRILQQLYKAKKPLHCEICKQQKKSVLGYLSHKSICQVPLMDVESVKVACHLCGRKMLPVSMDYHMKTHNKPAKYTLLENSEYLDVTGPRKAAKQALQVIKSIKGEFVNSSKYYASQCDFEDDFVINELKKKVVDCPDLECIFNPCEFKTSCIDTMVRHLNSCDKKPEQYFVCKLCLTWCKEEREMKEHLKSIHNRVDTGDKDVEFDNESNGDNSEDDHFIEEVEIEKRRLRQKGKLVFMNNQRAKPIFLVHPIREQYMSLVYAQAYPWMYNFCEKYYTNLNLFEDFRNNEPWQVLDCDILNAYLPSRHKSCDITVKTLTAKENLNDIGEVDFTRLDLFEVRNFYRGESTIYCGGPISALAWLPTPYNHENQNQILAVAVLNKSEKEYFVGRTYNEPCVIQLWSIGQLDWRQVTECDFKPFLLFGLALTAGPVWHLEWCPSGCLDLSEDENRCRLGLLAVATSDSFVYIYCIDNIKDKSERGVIYKGEPIAKLQLEFETSSVGQPYYATRISWTKAAGHRYVAVGYSSGMIALFDLRSISPLLQRRDQAGTQIILPYQTFQGHISCITALTLGHFGEGKRWCFSASLDKCLTFWDLSNMTKVASHRKYCISEGLWLTQWPTCLIAEDESTFNEMSSAHSFIRPIRDVMSQEFCSFTSSPSGLKSIAFSDWLNLIIHGSNAGEVLGQFSHRMFFNVDKKCFKKSYTKCIFSVTKLINKDRTNNKVGQSATYDEATTNFGIAFVDYNSDNLSKIPNSQTNNINIGIEKYNIHDYPLQAVSKVAANPHPQACTFYAAGYQAGFVRIRAMEFLKAHFNPRMFAEYDFSSSL